MIILNKTKKNNPRFKESRRLGLNVYRHPKAMKKAKRGSARDDKKLSEYGMQLLEKQRLKAYYNIREKQFRRYYDDALKSDKTTGTALVQSLETRLDNLVYRIGFASSIRQARQMVVHGHILVNDKKINIPSYQIKVGDIIELKDSSQKNELFKNNYLDNLNNKYPYLDKDKSFKAKLISNPEREDIPIEIEDQLVVEYYSRLS